VSAEGAWKALAEVNGWIRFADAKAAALLSLSGLLGGWILAMLGEPGQTPARSVALVAGLGPAVCTAFLALRALRPARPAGPDRPGAGRSVPPSLLYFADVARRYGDDPAAYVRDCAGLLDDEERLVREICDQVWVNSRIAARKFRQVDRGVFVLAAGLVMTAAAVAARGW
jgi:hypothetical protein